MPLLIGIGGGTLFLLVGVGCLVWFLMGSSSAVIVEGEKNIPPVDEIASRQDKKPEKEKVQPQKKKDDWTHYDKFEFYGLVFDLPPNPKSKETILIDIDVSGKRWIYSDENTDKENYFECRALSCEIRYSSTELNKMKTKLYSMIEKEYQTGKETFTQGAPGASLDTASMSGSGKGTLLSQKEISNKNYKGDILTGREYRIKSGDVIHTVWAYVSKRSLIAVTFTELENSPQPKIKKRFLDSVLIEELRYIPSIKN